MAEVCATPAPAAQTHQEEITELWANFPLWMPLKGTGGIEEAMQLVTPRSYELIRRDLQNGIGEHVARKRLGRHNIYRKSDVIEYAAAFVEQAETFEGTRNDMVAKRLLAEEAKAEAVQQK